MIKKKKKSPVRQKNLKKKSEFFIGVTSEPSKNVENQEIFLSSPEGKRGEEYFKRPDSKKSMSADEMKRKPLEEISLYR